jgi:hypothetical protein
MTAARVPTDALTLALLGLAERGERTHCSDPTSHHLWLSDCDADRATAVMLCDHCPVLTVCRDTAKQRDERWAFGAAATSQLDQDVRRPHDLAKSNPTPLPGLPRPQTWGLPGSVPGGRT